jgi:uncharacterized protein YceH (UPF0502 family)
MRHRFKLSEPQLAILTELMLRGRQKLGELRTRTSRMVAIDTQEQLKDELLGLLAMKLLQTTGDLERRGTEVDHNLYRPKENMKLEANTSPEPDEPAPRSAEATTSAAASPVVALDGGMIARLTTLETEIEDLRAENRELRELVESVRLEMGEMQTAFENLRQDLGG